MRTSTRSSAHHFMRFYANLSHAVRCWVLCNDGRFVHTCATTQFESVSAHAFMHTLSLSVCRRHIKHAVPRARLSYFRATSSPSAQCAPHGSSITTLCTWNIYVTKPATSITFMSIKKCVDARRTLLCGYGTRTSLSFAPTTPHRFISA